MQVDWTSGIITAPPRLSPGYDTGVYLRIGPGGVEVQRSPAMFMVRDEDPSSSRTFAVKCLTPGSLWVSGNPVKLLQGHNLWGSCNPSALFLEAGIWVRQQAGLFPGAETWRASEFSGPRWTRLDLTRSYRFANPADVPSWIQHVAGASRSRHGAPKLYDSGTAVWGEGSKRWMFKVYDKRQELIYQSKRRGKERQRLDGTLMDWAAGVIRFELQLRRKELDKTPDDVAALSGPDSSAAALRIWQSYHDRIDWNSNAAMTEPTLLDRTLPAHLEVKLGAWRGGTDLRAVLTRRSFYRARRLILDATGIDIASPAPPRPVQAEPPAAGLDPAGWDPEPLEAYSVEPSDDLIQRYGLDQPRR